jgi:hypothetical protein
MARWYVKTDKNGTEIWANDTCNRCGGRGASEAWKFTGCTCYECGGSGRSKVHLEKQYTPEYKAKLEARAKVRHDKKQREWEAGAAERNAEKNLNTLHRYGFQELDAYAVLGNTFDIKDQLKEAGAKFSPELHWVCPTEPTWIISNTYIRINVADVFTMTDGLFVLKDDATAFIDAFEPVRGNHIGKVGQKISATVTLIRSVPYDSTFGYRTTTGHIYIFETDSKDTLVWKTTSAWLDVDKTYQLVGTVKEHSEYNKVKQTVLTRCKVN